MEEEKYYKSIIYIFILPPNTYPYLVNNLELFMLAFLTVNKLLFVILLGFGNILVASSSHPVLYFGSVEKTANLPADEAANYIIDTSINHLINFNKQNQSVTNKQVIELIHKQFIPFFNINYSASQTLKKYWANLTKNQQSILEQYIINSLIKDYSAFLINYKEIDSVKITVDPHIKQKSNKAIVILSITTSNNQTIKIAVKMIKNQYWQLYDIVISGVSVVKNYEQQFNSYIKRKGFEQFEKKFLN